MTAGEHADLVGRAGPAARTRRRGRMLLWALSVSLLANGFLVGMAAMGYFSEEQRRRGPLSIEFRSIGDRLPDEYRDTLRDEARVLLPDFRENWRELRALRGEIALLASRPELDRPAIDERLARIREIATSMQERLQTNIFDTVGTFPEDVRAGLEPDEEDEDRRGP